MKVLLIGSAAAASTPWLEAPAEPAAATELYCAPGNPGIDERGRPGADRGRGDRPARRLRQRDEDRPHGGGARAAAGPGHRRRVRAPRSEDLRADARRRGDRGQQGLRQGVHGPPRHPDGAVRDRRRRGRGAPRCQGFRFPGGAQGRRSGRGQRRVHRARRPGARRRAASVLHRPPFRHQRRPCRRRAL